MRKLPYFKLPEILTLLGIFFLDRVTKFAASCQPPGGSKSFRIFDFFHITYVENTGAAFGIGKNLNTAFIFITIILIGFILYHKNNIADLGIKAKTAVLFILGGALGNLYDRIFHGSVIDFLDFRIWPVFNVADSFITIGGILLAWVFLKKGRQYEKK
jgi:signal peptidase II